MHSKDGNAFKPSITTDVQISFIQGENRTVQPVANGKPYEAKVTIRKQEIYVDPDRNVVCDKDEYIDEGSFTFQIKDVNENIVPNDCIVDAGQYFATVDSIPGMPVPTSHTVTFFVAKGSSDDRPDLSDSLELTIDPKEVDYTGEAVCPDITVTALINGKRKVIPEDQYLLTWNASADQLSYTAIGSNNLSVVDLYGADIKLITVTDPAKNSPQWYKYGTVIDGVEYKGSAHFKDVFEIKQISIATMRVLYDGKPIAEVPRIAIPSSITDQHEIENYIIEKLTIYRNANSSVPLRGINSRYNTSGNGYSYNVTVDTSAKTFVIAGLIPGTYSEEGYGKIPYYDTLIYHYEVANPEVPDTPATPILPTEPENPDIPEEPTDPEVPNVPDEPTEPVVPDTPEVPDTPVDPTEPADPIVPTDPETPSTGWIETDTGWQYKDENGEAAADTWQKVNGNWYHFDNTGTMQTGWVKDNNTWYYLNKTDEGTEGAMAKGWKQVDSTWYYLDNSGAMQTGWQNINGVWYHLNTSGAMTTGWVKDNDTWYYCNKNGEGTEGKMAVGWKEVDNTWYYFNTSGAMQTGWQKVNSSWYYLSASGAMQTGWQQINGAWYYLNPADGAMAANTWISNYYVDASGKWVSSH